MTLNPTLIAQLNTPANGASGASTQFAAPDTPGNAGQVGNDVWSGLSFFDPTAYLSLYPTANGGFGSTGTSGSSGKNAGGTSTSVGGVTTLQFGNGQDGQPGGNGGAAGGAVLDFAGFTIGSVATPNYYAGITANATGGTGASGAWGGSGGTAGINEQDGVPVTFYEFGGLPGNGAAGGAGGNGGDANATIDLMNDVTTGGAYFTLQAKGGYGGNGAIGGNGGQGGATSFGGAGGAGGAGGNANAVLSNSNLLDTITVNVGLTAIGGTGGGGGQGANAGFSTDLGNPSAVPGNTTVTTYGANPSGGAGGNGGTAFAALTSSTLTAPNVYVTMLAETTAPGTGGSGSSQVSSVGVLAGNTTEVIAGATGPTGPTGSAGGESMVFSGNTLTVSSTAALSGIGLTLNIGSSSPANPNAVPLNGGPGGNFTFTGNSFIGAGNSDFNVAYMGGGVTLDALANTISINGSPANPMTGFNDFNLGKGDTLVLGTAGPYYVYVSSDPDTVVLTPGHASAIIGSVTPTDLVLDFRGYGTALPDLAHVIADTSYVGGNTVITIPGDGSVTLSAATWTPTAQDTVVACFRAGTLIGTPRGEVAVEALRAGDQVVTASGRVVAVTWIGHRRLRCDRHPRPEDVWPVRVAAGAFAPGRPRRDLYLSPDHALYVGARLVPVKYLINGASVEQVRCDEVVYYHVELPCHDVLLAEGLPAESYLDTGNRAAFENGGGVVEAHPDFARRIWQDNACAPLLLKGPPLTAVRRALIRRLPALGHGVTTDPGLRLALDGRDVEAQRFDRTVCLVLPPGGGRLRLSSRSARPIELDAASDDTRVLGVAVAGVRCDGVLLACDDRRFMAGWYAAEGEVRWTDGAAWLDMRGVELVEIELAPTVLRYHVDREDGVARVA